MERTVAQSCCAKSLMHSLLSHMQGFLLLMPCTFIVVTAVV